MTKEYRVTKEAGPIWHLWKDGLMILASKTPITYDIDGCWHIRDEEGVLVAWVYDAPEEREEEPKEEVA